METDKLYLDDLKVGDIFQSREYLVTEAEIIEFAKKYDPQIFHTDKEAAKKTFFGELVSSGWLTSGITMRLMYESFPLANGLIGMGVELDWKRSVIADERLKLKSEIMDIKMLKSKPGQGIIYLLCTVTNERGELCMTMNCKVLSFTKGTKVN